MCQVVLAYQELWFDEETLDRKLPYLYTIYSLSDVSHGPYKE